MEDSILNPTQRYAASALFALALHHAQLHQTHPFNTLPPLDQEPIADAISNEPASPVFDESKLWIHDEARLLWPVLRLMRVDEQSWTGIKETAGSSTQVRHHVGAFLQLLSEANDETSRRGIDKELALEKTVDATVRSEEIHSESVESKDDVESQENHVNSATGRASDKVATKQEAAQRTASEMPAEEVDNLCIKAEESVEEGMLLGRREKLTLLYELLSACLAGVTKDDEKSPVGKGYDARHRVALRLLATWLDVDWTEMEALEFMVACSLMSPRKEECAEEEEHEGTTSPHSKWKRGGIIGAAAFTGGALMAITGGLAAPAVAHGLGALAPTLGSILPGIGAGGFAAAATATGSAAGSIAIAASFGAAGAGLVGTKMARRTGSLEEFEFKEIGNNHNKGRLAVEICVSGLAFEEDDFSGPWNGCHDNTERYALQWESRNLIALGTAIQDWLTSKITIELMKEGAMMTVLSSLMTALTLPATLLTATDFIDSKWAIAVDRSDKAGKELADVLLKGLQGNRPVTLIGFSLGARVIFKCLQVLYKAGEDNVRLIEKVFLLGAPIPIKDENWETARKIVAGRFVNAYSTNDWTLGIVFRPSLLSQGLAGIQPVDVAGVENVDVTKYIEGHSSYIRKSNDIVKSIDIGSDLTALRSPKAARADEGKDPS